MPRTLTIDHTWISEQSLNLACE